MKPIPEMDFTEEEQALLDRAGEQTAWRLS
jgi:hypothetical protein